MAAPSQRRRVRSPSQDSGIERSPAEPAWRRIILKAMMVQNHLEASNTLLNLGCKTKVFVDSKFMRNLIRRSEELDRMEMESLIEATRAEEEELAEWESAGGTRRTTSDYASRQEEERRAGARGRERRTSPPSPKRLPTPPRPPRQQGRSRHRESPEQRNKDPEPDTHQRPLLCECGLEPRVYTCRVQGRNYRREFWRCPRPSRQCDYFVWKRDQPHWEEPENRYEKGNSDPVGKCSHTRTTRAGSNAYMNQIVCKDCGMTLLKEKTELAAVREAAKRR